MASYRGHLAFSTALGVGYGGMALWGWQLDWGPALIAAGVTALGGLLPDLDSDSGVPVRELFGLSAAAVPFLIYQRVLTLCDASPERTLAILAGLYLLIRYGLSKVFRRLTVHRGMFHSIPAICIAGLGAYLVYHTEEVRLRLLVAAGIMLGFLSHLVLDELCSVDFNGLTVKLNQFAGSALKLRSDSWPATLVTYLVLAALGWSAYQDWQLHRVNPRELLPRSSTPKERPAAHQLARKG